MAASFICAASERFRLQLVHHKLDPLLEADIVRMQNIFPATI